MVELLPVLASVEQTEPEDRDESEEDIVELVDDRVEEVVSAEPRPESITLGKTRLQYLGHAQ